MPPAPPSPVVKTSLQRNPLDLNAHKKCRSSIELYPKPGVQPYIFT